MLLYKDLLDTFVTMTRQIIREHLTGIYLHGSMAMGCFHPEKSDIDLIIVIEDSISNQQKLEFMHAVVRLNQQAPKKGIELSIVKKAYCCPFVYPTPFELHFSPIHLQRFYDNPQNYIETMHGTDIDLAAHFTVLQHYGIVLYGEPIKKVFDIVPPNAYLDSICADIATAHEDCNKDPISVSCNLCRVLAFLKEGCCLSKKAGGEWGIAHLSPNWHPLIQEILECYTTNTPLTATQHTIDMFVDELMHMIDDTLTQTF